MKYIKFFNEINFDDRALVGGKNAALGDMIQNLSPAIPIPEGFAITVDGYRYLLQAAAIVPGKTADTQQAIQKATIPEDLKQEIIDAYGQLSGRYGQQNLVVAVRSSATTEDMAGASSAGQQESYVHIRGVTDLLVAVKNCMASLFTPRAVAYRKEKGFHDEQCAISVGVQKMITCDNGTSGVIFTLETESGHRDFVTINAAYGLGQALVGGRINPDEYMVHKGLFKKGFSPLVKKVCGDKQVKALYASEKNALVYQEVIESLRNRFALVDQQIFELVHYALIIEDYFSARNGVWTPMDIEWAQDGLDGKIYIVQARPETVHAHNQPVLKLYRLDVTAPLQLLVEGLSIGRAIASGRVKRVDSPEAYEDFQAGDILVTTMTDPDWVPIMEKAAAIITDRGGRTCHAAIIARELGLPALVGTGNGTCLLKNGQHVTVDCSAGTYGAVYDGDIPYFIEQVRIDEISSERRPVDILVNIANPDNACQTALLPIDGAGLVRLEFIIARRIGIHPLAIIFPERVTDTSFHKQASLLQERYGSLTEAYLELLSMHVGLIAGAFYPRPVTVRLTDFKSNEYKNLLGGTAFEPIEENPMLGFRGASRYGDPLYQAAFELECKALARVRDDMGFDNMIIMVPFVRTVAQAHDTIALLAHYGLERGKNGLKIYLMVEIPSNIILFDEFAPFFDGFSIGSNDLTQLTLGIDRDSGLLRHLFSEQDPAVKALIAQAIIKAHQAGKHISICGQAPSDFPDFAQWLINQKIDALSLNADAIVPFMQS